MIDKKKKDELVFMESRFMAMTELELRNYRALWYPGGPGPTNAMYDITALTKVVGRLRGFDVEKWDDADV